MAPQAAYRLAPKTGNFKVSREEWVGAARQTLIDEGIEAVKVDTLSRKLNVTRGGFYWFFRNRQQLLDSLLDDWEVANNRAFVRSANESLGSGRERLEQLARLWVEETDYSPLYDAAVRRWAAIAPAVYERVRKVDEGRIALIKGMFVDIGFPENEAFIRARITYFHQVGYYAMGVSENPEERLALLPLYLKVLAE